MTRSWDRVNLILIMYLKILFPVCLLFTILSVAEAQDRQYIKGIVVSHRGGNPIEDVTVTANGTIRTETDSKGQFSLVLPKQESYTFNIYLIGYTPQKQIITSSELSDTLIFRLEEDIARLSEVVVTGTRSRKPIKDSPVLTRVITAGDIGRANASSLTGLLESELPGLEFTSNAGVPNINMNGLGGNYVLFLIDGERIAGETRNNIDYDILNLNNIERIEIVKGALSTLYGSNAMGGVVNIITKQSTKSLNLNLSSRFGSYGEQQYGINGGTMLKRFSSWTSASWKTSDNFILEDKAFLKKIYSDSIAVDPILRDKEVEGGESLNIEQKAGYRISDKLNADLKGNYFKRERFNAGAEGTVMHNFYYGYSGNSRIGWKISEHNQLEATYHYSHYDKFNYYHQIDIEEKDYTNRLHNARTLLHSRLTAKQSLTSGAEYLTENLSTYMFAKGDRFSADSYTVYTEHDFQAGPRINTITGVRWDKHSNYGGNLSPKFAIKYELMPHTTLRASYATGFRSPSLKELYTNWDHLGMFQIIGNADLRPEKNRNISLSATYNGNGFYVSANAFHNNIRNKLDLLWNDTNDTVYYNNVDRQKIKGAELMLVVSPARSLRLQAGYSFTDDGYKEGNKNFSPTRPHSATFKAEQNIRLGKINTSLSLNGKFLSSVDVYSQDSNDQYYRIAYPGYTIWRMSISGQYKNGMIFNAGINNLLDYQAEVNSFYSSISPGRTYFLSLSFNLDSFSKNKLQ